MIKNVLSIAGSDPSGGAGIQADLKTFSALGCYGMSVITALTAQNTKGVRGIHTVPADFLEEQLESIFIDIEVHAVKIGMVGSVDNIYMLMEYLKRFHAKPVVLDPVMVSTSGDRLLSMDAEKILREKLIPMASVITPNLPEAMALLGRRTKDEPEVMAKRLLTLGVPYVLLKGGHDEGKTCTDILAGPEGVERFEGPRLPVRDVHGTGCTLSSALACFLAQGMGMKEAAGKAKDYVSGALSHSGDLKVGRGAKPVHHFHALWP